MSESNKSKNRIITAEVTAPLYDAVERYRRRLENSQNRFVSKREVVGTALAALIGAAQVE